MRYVAYAVDCPALPAQFTRSIARQTKTRTRAENFLDAHPVVEVSDGARRVVRLVRESSN